MNIITQIERFYNRASMREKILILIVIFSLIYVVMDKSFTESNRKLAATSMESWQNQNILYSEVESQIASVQDRLKSVPALKKKNIQSLIHENQKIKNQINAIQKDLISPQEMIDAVKQILLESNNIKIISFSHLDTVPIGDEAAELYRQVFNVSIEGEVDEVLGFFNKIQKFKKPFFIESVEYRMTKAPSAEVNIRMYSLSDTKQVLKF